MLATQGPRARGRGLLLRFTIVEVFVAVALTLFFGLPQGGDTPPREADMASVRAVVPK